MATTGTLVGTYTNPTLTLNAQGEVIFAESGSSAGAPSDVITVNNDSGAFAGSYQLKSGTNVTLTPAVGPPNTLTIAAAGSISSLTGDVTGSGTGAVATTIANSVVSNAKLANMAANTIKGNNTGGSAAPLDLTVTQTTAMLNPLVGDSGSGGTKGLVPAPAAGDAAANKFLNADGTFKAVSGTISVTHIVSGGGSSSITAQTGVGTAGTASITGTDTTGIITANAAGAGVLAPCDIVLITFALPWSAAPSVLIWPANTNAAKINPSTVGLYSTSTTTTFKLSGALTGLAPTATYQWYYFCIQ